MEKVSINKLTEMIDELKSTRDKEISCIPDIEGVIKYLESYRNELSHSRFMDESIVLQQDIDRKFIFLALNPFTGSYYTQKDAFIMTAKDLAVPEALSVYIEKCKELGADVNQVKSAQLLLSRVNKYQATHITKVPDVSSEREIAACTKSND